MNMGILPRLQKVTWGDIEKEVATVNPKLANIINQISPDKCHRLYLGIYPYGSTFSRGGKCYIPNSSGQWRFLGDTDIATQIKDDLSYNSMSNPACIILDKSVELYIENDLTIVPVLFGIIPAGKILSTSYVLSNDAFSYHPRFDWNLSAGARSIFLLPKVTNKRKFNRLRKVFTLTSKIPTSYQDHWHIFSELNQAANLNWNLKILFFSKAWFNHKQDKSWDPFYNYLMASFHDSYHFWTYKFMWDMAFTFVMQKLRLKMSTYIFSTVKHLLFMASGAVFGMAPALDEKTAPISKIQDIFINCYGLTDYIPTIIVPTMFNPYDNNTRCVYYSLQYPNLMEITPRPRQYDSVLADVYEVFSTLRKYINVLDHDLLNLSGSVLVDIPKLAVFEAFHTDSEPYHAFKNTSEMAQIDTSLITKVDGTVYPKKQFAQNASFVRGCIRVSRREAS